MNRITKWCFLIVVLSLSCISGWTQAYSQPWVETLGGPASWLPGDCPSSGFSPARADAADDFILSDGGTIGLVRWWAAVSDAVDGDGGPSFMGFAIIFYADDHCQPGDILQIECPVYPYATELEQSYPCRDRSVYVCYDYVQFNASLNTRYWLSIVEIDDYSPRTTQPDFWWMGYRPTNGCYVGCNAKQFSQNQWHDINDPCDTTCQGSRTLMDLAFELEVIQ